MHTIEKACANDIAQIHEVIQLAFEREARRYNNWQIAPLVETPEQLLTLLPRINLLVAREDGVIVGTGRITLDGVTARIGRLAVLPDYQRKGIASSIVKALEACHPAAERFEIFTSERSVDNIRLYAHLGYRIYDKRTAPDGTDLVYMEKKNAPVN